MSAAKLDRVDLILADVQGAETVLLNRAKEYFQAGRVRFVVVATHHHSISGNPLTHQDALTLLTDAGGHVISEHTVGESVSGDGLIVVSFDDRDRDLEVPISYARYRDSMFGELEFDLAHAQQRADQLRAELSHMTSERDVLQTEISAIMATKMWRWAKIPRQAYARIRRGLQ